MLQLANITKKFGRHTALQSIDLRIAEGEIHGIAGANGSGKSTLLNILFGSPVIAKTGGYQGKIYLRGRHCKIKSPQSAILSGFGMVHQELTIIPEMSVAANVTITREPVHPCSGKLFGRDFSLIDRAQCEVNAATSLATLGLSLRVQQKTGQLPLAIKQFVEIAREISRNDLKVLLLDEPTAVLNSGDSAILSDTLRILAKKGVSLIYVSHRLDELFRLCDNLTVLRNGRISRQFSRLEFDQEAVTESMIGDAITSSRKNSRRNTSDIIVRLRDVSVKMPGEAINNLDLDIERGEILGLISLSGHGKMALGPGLMGQSAISGSITINNRQIAAPDPASMIAQGVFMLPEDRRRAGLLLQRSIAENITFSAIHCSHRFLRRFLFSSVCFPDREMMREYAEECIKSLEITCTGPSQKVYELSGGNQQKVCIARALALEPEILFVNEPTRGVDLNAKERILDLFLSTNERKGTTIVIASSELDELKRICNRIAVLYCGRLCTILSPAADDKTFIRGMSGERAEQ